MTEWRDSAEVAPLALPDLSKFQSAADGCLFTNSRMGLRISVARYHPIKKDQQQKVWNLSIEGVHKYFAIHVGSLKTNFLFIYLFFKNEQPNLPVPLPLHLSVQSQVSNLFLCSFGKGGFDFP